MDHVVWRVGDKTVEVSGKSAHASRPTLGENALIKLAYLNPESNDLFRLVNSIFEPDGEHKLTFEEAIRHKKDISMCIGKVRNGTLYVDLRVPPELELDRFADAYEETMKSYGIRPVQTDCLPGSITKIDSEFSKVALKCYQDITGDYESQPYSTGSATYGRSYETGCITFGPRMHYHITNTHRPNEFITFDLIDNAFAIYVHTLKTMEEEL